MLKFGNQVPQVPPINSYEISLPAKDWSGNSLGKDGEMLTEYTRTVQDLVKKLKGSEKFKAALHYVMKCNYVEEENNTKV